MQDRRHRATLRTPLQQQGSMLLRERRPSSTESDDNPFAPPPANQPDQPWQPRLPANGDDDESSSSDPSSPSSPGRGGQWSPVQPGRQDGGFGSVPQRPKEGPKEPDGGKGGSGPGLRWDPKDPAQRRARYALLAGMWAFFFALFNLPEIGLLLGALALYWGISSLRAKPQHRVGEQAMNPRATADAGPPPAAPVPGPYPGSSKPQRTAAVSGLVTAGLALLIVALTFASQLVYRDYYSCVDDALTKQGQLDCNTLLPDSLVPILGTKK